MDIKALAKAKAKCDDNLETAKTRRAFEIFYNDGQNRTEQEVADILGVTQQTISIWREQYKWDDRIALIHQGKYISRIVGSNRDLVDSIDETLGLIATFKSQYKDHLPIIDMETVYLKDVVALAKLEIQLLNIKTNFMETVREVANELRLEIQEQIELGNADKLNADDIESTLLKMVAASPETRERIKERLIQKVGEDNE
mgnify:CR=1 FL=1